MTLPGSLGPRAELGRRRVTGGRPLLIPEPVATRADVCRHGFPCDACLDGRAGANCNVCRGLVKTAAQHERADARIGRARATTRRIARPAPDGCIHGRRPGACPYRTHESCGTAAAPVRTCIHGRVRGQCPYPSCTGPRP